MHMAAYPDVEANSTSSSPTARLTRSRKRKRAPSPPIDLTKFKSLAVLPPAVLLLCLPRLLAHPPDHKFHIPSLSLSLTALRKCLSFSSLAPDIECRAYAAFAEIGMKVIVSNLSQSEHYPWAKGMELEVEKAIGKGLLLSQNNPSLITYKHLFTLLHTRLAHWQRNIKFSQSLLKRLTASLSFQTQTIAYNPSSSPPWLTYTVHLTAMSHALSLVPPDLSRAFSALQDLLDASLQLGDKSVTLLSHVVRLRTLVDVGMWDAVRASLELAESALGLSYVPMPPTPVPATLAEKEQGKPQLAAAQTFVAFEDTFEAAMAVHVLIIGVAYFTHSGMSQGASPRLSHLHALLDSDTLDGFQNGTIDIPLKSGPPLTIKCTHPRVLFNLTYLVSSVSKRDAVGRKPRRKVFATEGLRVLEKEARKAVQLPVCATLQDVEEVDERLVKIKADLLSELVAVSVMRSEFDEAECHLASLTAHTRTYQIFPMYAARITLHHAHLAHALGRAPRARECYAAAAHLADSGTFVHVAARAGTLALSIGSGLGRDGAAEQEETVKDLVGDCGGMGGTLEAIGHILHACVSPEILTAKSHLKTALDLASQAQDNHLRALVLALISSLYIRTAEEHARAMLVTCGQLAAGLGAPATKHRESSEASSAASEERPPAGNAPLGLWVGQRFLELYKRAGNEQKAQKQELANAQLSKAVEWLSQRKPSFLS